MKLTRTFNFKALMLTFAALITATLPSCMSDSLQPNDNAADRQPVYNENELVPGIVHVKFEPEVGDAIEANLTAFNAEMAMKAKANADTEENAQSAAEVNAQAVTRAFTGNGSLGELADMIKITKIERTFPPAGKFEPRTRARGMHLWYNVYFEPETTVTRAMDGFTDIEGIQLIEPQPVMRLFDDTYSVPADPNMAQAGTRAETGDYFFNDPRLPDQWHYANDGSYRTYETRADINVIDAWRKQTGHPDVIVSVVDMGVEYEHPDIAANMWVNEIELYGASGIDDDNNGYVDDINGWNFMHNSRNVMPGHHGTHVAGTIAAINNNGIGVSGIAGGDGTPGSGARIMSCMIFNPSGQVANDANIAAAIKYGADNGAVISQNSWGGGQFTQVLRDAIDYFVEFAGMDENGVQRGPMAGGVVIFAAGNTPSEYDAYPGAYASTIAVASIGPSYKAASYTTYGRWVDISAPGGEYGDNRLMVLSLGLGGDYVYNLGTSMACPHVSGVAALMVSEFGVGKPGYTPQQLKDRLFDSVNDVYKYNIKVYPNDPDYTGRLGSGMVDAAKALYDDEGIAPEIVSDIKIVWADARTMNLSWGHVADHDMYAASEYAVYVSGEPFTANDVVSMTPAKTFMMPAVTAIGEEVVYKASGLDSNKTYWFAVAAYDIFGNVSISQVRKSMNSAPVVAKEFEDVYLSGNTNPELLELSDYFIDSDGDTLNYEVTVTGNAATAIEQNGILTVAATGWGEAEVAVTATDPSGDSVSSGFKVFVRDNSKGMVLYPNPFTDSFNIKLGSIAGEGGSATVKLYNSTGMSAYNGNVVITPFDPAAVEASNLSSGQYTVVVGYNGKEYRSTIIKI